MLCLKGQRQAVYGVLCNVHVPKHKELKFKKKTYVHITKSIIRLIKQNQLFHGIFRVKPNLRALTFYYCVTYPLIQQLMDQAVFWLHQKFRFRFFNFCAKKDKTNLATEQNFCTFMRTKQYFLALDIQKMINNKYLLATLIRPKKLFF